MEVVVTVRLGMVPRAGVEPARPYGQRILSPFRRYLPHSTTRYQVVSTDVSAVKASYVWIGTNTYPPHLPLILAEAQTPHLPLTPKMNMHKPGHCSRPIELFTERRRLCRENPAGSYGRISWATSVHGLMVTQDFRN